MRIRSAAIRQDGEVFVGGNHAEIIGQMIKRGVAAPIRGEQGFVTDTGAFVGREEAARIALASGQVKRLRYSRTMLYSEDLNYPEERMRPNE